MDLNVVNYHQLSNALWGCEHGFFLIGENLDTIFVSDFTWVNPTSWTSQCSGTVGCIFELLDSGWERDSNFWTLVGKENLSMGAYV